MKKRLLLLLSMIACLFSLVACGKNADNAKKTLEFDKKLLIESAGTLIEDLNALSDDELDEILSSDDNSTFEYKVYEAWKQNKDELGKLVKINDYKCSSTDKEVKCVVSVTFEKRNATVTIVQSKTGDSFRIEPKYTLGEKLKKAVLNTILGMGTVFLVLVFISFLISLFKYVNKIENNIKAKKEAKISEKDVAKNAVDNTIAQIVEKEENELVDDTELVAVITAAIAASQSAVAPGDFVVRSIKRVKKNNWNRA